MSEPQQSARGVTRVAVIVSTYRNSGSLSMCLDALHKQSFRDFEIVIADDGSGENTRRVIERFQSRSDLPVRHCWQADRGFRKTIILNKAVAGTDAEYLVFIDGDCLAHADFVAEHLKAAGRGRYVNGSLIRLNAKLTGFLLKQGRVDPATFRTRFLWRNGSRFDRRFLRLSLPYGLRCRLNRISRTRLYWLGSNSSCFREDAVAVNGFDNRFTYGFEDGDFGYRLENFGLKPVTVRWTAVLLHLDHGKPWSDPVEMERNRLMMAPRGEGCRYRAVTGLEEVMNGSGRDVEGHV